MAIEIIVLDLMRVHIFHCKMVNEVKMLLFFELAMVLPCMMIKEKKRYLSSW